MSNSKLLGSQNYVWSMADVLGTGATGSVCVARHKTTGKLRAVKTFNQMSHMRPYDVQMREFMVLEKLDHENIVKLLAIEEESTTKSKIIVMELCTGGSLYTMLDDPQNSSGLEETEFFHVLKDVAAGMKHLRDQGIVHRDIKPGNIMRYITEEGRSIYKLADFGAARELQEEENFMSLYGTEEYLHPDLYERAVLRRHMGKVFDASVDLWSIGVTLYHTATGQLPFRPFGGRKSRDTMHKITTEKESGMISGVQHKPGGDIEWSRELPKECRLTQGAKNLIIPLLAGLLETDDRRMWSFDKFFSKVNEIVNKHVISVFDVFSAKILHIYINKNESYAKFLEQITVQTDLHAENMFLLFENDPLSKTVSQLQPVISYPETNDSYPMFLFSVEMNEFPKLDLYRIPHELPFENSLKLDQDWHYSKQVAAQVANLTRYQENVLHRQMLLHRAVKMYHSVLLKEVDHARNCITQYSCLCEETEKRVAYFIDSSLKEVELVKLSWPSNQQSEHPDCKALLQELTRISYNTADGKNITEILGGMHEMNSYISDYSKRLIDNRELGKKWNEKNGCLEKERCKPKLEIIFENVKKTSSDFKRDRKLPRMTQNEEQIHKFDKSQLRENFIKASSLVQDHCYPNISKVFKRFTEWYNMACKTRGKLTRIQNRVSSLGDRQSEFADKLDSKCRDYRKKLNMLTEKLHGANMKTNFKKMPPSELVTDSQIRPFDSAYNSSNKQLNEEDSIFHKSLDSLEKGLSALAKETKALQGELKENEELLKKMDELSNDTDFISFTNQLENGAT